MLLTGVNATQLQRLGNGWKKPELFLQEQREDVAPGREKKEMKKKTQINQSTVARLALTAARSEPSSER